MPLIIILEQRMGRLHDLVTVCCQIGWSDLVRYAKLG